MKENTKRALVWLYPASGKPLYFTKTQISLSVPSLTPAGISSMLYLLEKKQLVESHQVQSETTYGLTGYGIKVVESEIPALSTSRFNWQGNWTAVVGIQAPKSDQNFRYLREQLVVHQLIPLTRAVFLFPGSSLPARLQAMLETLYPHAVAVLAVSGWQWGDESAIIGHNTDLKSLMELYSGISSEIGRLIVPIESSKEINYQSKLPIVSLFDRLYSGLKSDFGLGKRFFPQVKFGRELLADLQLLG